jgi:hypothetical protein
MGNHTLLLFMPACIHFSYHSNIIIGFLTDYTNHQTGLKNN